MSWKTKCLLYDRLKKADKSTEGNFFTELLRTSHAPFLVNDQRDTQIIFYVFIYIYNSLYVSSSSSGEKNCINTTSGSCHSVLVAVLCAGCK